jgi:hypothetical protein
LLALFAARIAAHVLAVSSDTAAAARQQLVAQLNSVGSGGGRRGGHAALEVWPKP